MGDVFELPIVKAIKEIEELAQTIKAKKMNQRILSLS